MGFVSPYYLLLLLVALMAVILINKGQLTLDTRRTALGLRSQSIPSWIFWLTLLGMIVIGVARPYVGSESVPVSSMGSNILVLLDVSKSMLAEDIRPNRLEAAKRKILDLVELRRSQQLQDRIGIVLFSGNAYLYAPPTEDYSVIKTYVQAIQSSMIPNPGSGLNEAILTALGSLASMRSSSSHLLLLSDGEDDGFMVNQAVSELKRRHTPLSAIGIGTTHGAPMPQPNGGFLKDESGSIVISKLAEEPLKSVTEESGGSYAQYSIQDDDLKIALRTTKTSSQKNTSSVTQYGERGHLLIGSALLILLLSAFSKFRTYVLPLLLFISPALAKADSLAASARSYEEGRFEDAISGFNKNLREAPKDFNILQGLGSAQFKAKKTQEAVSSFQKLAEIAESPDERFISNYNLGNSYLEAEKFQEAIDAYDEALQYNKDEIRAVTNREIARQRLKKKEENQQESSKNDNSSSSDDSKHDSESEQNGNPEPQNQEQDKNSNQKNSDNTRDEQSPSKEEKKSEDAPSPDHTPSGVSTPTTSSELENKGALDQDEAQRWLNSLPEAPVLLRRKTGKSEDKPTQGW